MSLIKIILYKLQVNIEFVLGNLNTTGLLWWQKRVAAGTGAGLSFLNSYMISKKDNLLAIDL